MNGAAKRSDKVGAAWQRKKFNFWRAENVFIAAFACFAASFVLWINFQHVLCSLLLTVAGAVFYVLCNVIIRIYTKRARGKRYLLGILSVFNLTGSLLCFKSFIQEAVHHGINAKYGILGIGLLFLFLLAGNILVLFDDLFRVIPGLLWKNCIKILPLAVLFAALLLINADVFDTWLRWDNYEYYQYMERITFEALTEDIPAFRICGHQTYALSFLVLILNSITDDAIITAYLLNFIYLLGGYICFMALIRKLFLGLSFAEVYAGSLLYVLSPFFLGGMKCLNLEFYLAFSLLLYLAASAYGFKALQFIAGFMLIFGKETGMVIMFAIMAANMLWENIKIKSLKKYLKTEYFYFAFMVFLLGVLWLVDYKEHSWLTGNVFPYETVDGNTFNSLGVSWVYIRNKLKVLILSQFNWIFWAGIAVCLCFGIVKTLRRKTYVEGANVLKGKIWLDMLAAGAGCLAVNLFMITYNHYRYLSPLIPVLYLFFLRAVELIIRKGAVRCGIYCVASLLLFAQCFRTVDPVMRYRFTNLTIGKDAVLCSPPNNIIDFGSPFTGSVQYNRQIADFDVALDKLINCVDYDDDTCIVFSDEFRAKSSNKSGYIGTIHCIGGYGYQYSSKHPRYVSWDDQEGRRYLSDSDEDEMNIAYISSADAMKGLKQQYGRVIYIKMPWQDELYKNEIEKMALPETTTAYRGWELDAYTY